MEQGNAEQTPSTNEPQVNQSQQEVPPASPKLTSPKKPLIIVGILLGFVLFGVGGYVLGMQRGTQVGVTDEVAVPTQNPTTTPQPSPTSVPQVDSETELLEPSLVSTVGWRTVSFPQNIRVSQGGDTRPGNVELMIPSNWTTKTVQTRTGEGIGGGACNDFHLSNANGDTLLVIKPGCGDSNNDYLPISGQIQKVELITDKGNDSHDSHTVRYLGSTQNVYNYGSIGVSPGASIDIQKDQIYPNLILQYEPDRHEQWLWTSYDLTYTGTASNQQTAMSTADTIISTLKLTD